jgi:hypothetical protein
MVLDFHRRKALDGPSHRVDSFLAVCYAERVEGGSGSSRAIYSFGRIVLVNL